MHFLFTCILLWYHCFFFFLKKKAQFCILERNERQTWQQRAPGWGRGAGKSTRLFDNPFVLGFGLSLIPSNTTAIRINTHLNSNCDTPKLHSYSILHRRRPISVWIFLSPLLHWISQLSSKSCKGFSFFSDNRAYISQICSFYNFPQSRALSFSAIVPWFGISNQWMVEFDYGFWLKT